MKYTYSVESFFIDKWCKLFGSETRDFCSGYLTHAQYCHPRNALRIVRSDGKIMYQTEADNEVDIGMIAGWPTPEQYEAAAKRALEQAEHIRKQIQKQKEYRINKISIE